MWRRKKGQDLNIHDYALKFDEKYYIKDKKIN
jgi:hypothetical protein